MKHYAARGLLLCAVATSGLLAPSRGGAVDTARSLGVGQAATSPNELSLMQTRVGLLEKKLEDLQREQAALLKRYATHRHKYVRTAVDCHSTNLYALKKQLDANSGPGMGDNVCVLRAGSSAVDVATSGPTD